MGRTRFGVRLGAAGLLLGLLACRPVFAIGWEELVILFLLFLFLFWPVLVRLVRMWDAYKKSEKKKD